MDAPEDDTKSTEEKVKKEVITKQPLRTLPMRQAKLNASISLDEKARDSNRILRSFKTPTNNDNKPSLKAISTAKDKKDVKKDSTNTPTKTNCKKKDTDVGTSTIKFPVTTTQQVIRKPSLRAANCRIKAKNIKARSSKCQLFFCDKCERVYDHYSELVYHQRRHTGEKPFACTWPGCTAAFSASNARVRHMRIHTGEKPYVCPYSECGRKFTYWKDLKLHKLRHSGEKPHKCTWPGCSSRFFRRDDLKHHRYTHTGEKPYKCTFPGCESAFTQKSPLNLHMRKIHKILPNGKPLASTDQTNKINEVGNNNLPTSCQYPVYQEIPNNNIIRQPVNAQIQIPDGNSLNLHHQNNGNNNNHVSNNIMYANQTNNVQCMTVADKSSSILVTCDVSPAIVHGVSQSNQDINSWSGYAFIPGSVDCDQNMSNTARPIVDQLNDQCCMREPNVITKPADHSINHIPNLDDLLADACAASQIPIDNSTINITNNNNNLNPTNRFGGAEFLNNETNCAISTPRVSTSSTSTSATSCIITDTTSTTSNNITTVIAPIPRSSIIMTSTSDVDLLKQTNTTLSNETTSSMPTTSTDETSLTKGKNKLAKVNESVKTSKDASSPPIKTTRSVRKRANYRIKTPETVKKTIIAIIRQKPVIETKSRNKSPAKVDKLGAKRTIAIQTTKRQPAEKTKDGKFKCDYCEREFKAKHDRDCHHMTHTGEKPRACDWPGCDYRCITKSKLTRHRRKHTGERNYPCDWPGCGKAFSTSRHQKEHKRTHTGEKPFKCDYPGCDKWFARKDHIKNHRFTHTGEKPRKCSYPGCEAAFIQLSPLKKHMELHKRDNGPVPNRTRKRKTGTNNLINERSDEPIFTECPNNTSSTMNVNSADNVSINANQIQLDTMTLEMGASRMVSQHNQPVQSFNMLVQQENLQNVCHTSYESSNTINPNNQQVNIDYDTMFRHPTYC